MTARWDNDEATKQRDKARQAEYFKEARKQIKLAMSKQQAEQLEAFCKDKGIPVQTFIKNCIASEIKAQGGVFDWDYKAPKNQVGAQTGVEDD